MLVFVTGATGFIGGHLVHRLVKDGHQVRCLVRNPARAGDLKKLGVQIVPGSVNDRDALRMGMVGCGWLFHLANLYSMWEPDKDRFYEVNVKGTSCVFETALECQVEKVVYVSTVAVYGKPQEVPFNEGSTPGKSLFSDYARTKALGNRAAWEYCQTRGLPLVALYPGIVLGPGDDKASGQYIRDIVFRRVPSTIFHQSCSTYVHVCDVVEALLRAAENPAAKGQRYLVGGTSLSGKDFARMISQVSGVCLPLFHFPDLMVLVAAYLLSALSALTRRPPWWGLSIDAAWTLINGFVFDGNKVMRELGIDYTPVETAVSDAVQWYIAQRSSRKQDSR